MVKIKFEISVPDDLTDELYNDIKKLLDKYFQEDNNIEIIEGDI